MSFSQFVVLTSTTNCEKDTPLGQFLHVQKLFNILGGLVFFYSPFIWHSNINWLNLKWFDWLCALIFLIDLNLFDFQILNEIIWTNFICLINVDEKFDLNQVEILVFLNLFDLIWRVARKLRK